MYIKYIKKQLQRPLFRFSSLQCLNNEIRWKRCSQNIKQYFFQREIFVDITTFRFHSFNIFNDFVTTQYATAKLYSFYLNP